MSALEDVNTLEQAAEYLKATEAELKSLVRQGKIGSLKHGRTITFLRADIDTYVEKYRTPATPPNPFNMTTASSRRIRGRAA